MKRYNVAIIGGGILGVCMAYEISSRYECTVSLVEKERNLGMHASSRNTGVVHSPFYMDPDKKKRLAGAATASRSMWKGLAESRKIPWRDTGTLEVAQDDSESKTLSKYLGWGKRNGVAPESMTIMDADQVRRLEPHVRCHSALYCTSDAATDYGALTRELGSEAKRNRVDVLVSSRVSEMLPQDGILLGPDQGKILADVIINCAGGDSLDIAQSCGLALGYSDLHFRGEYWIARDERAGIIGTNIYTVAKFPEFPFLDPHWIRRADGGSEIGPNAVPVPTPETYEGFIPDIHSALEKIARIAGSGSIRLFANPEFISMISGEFLSSVSKRAMVERVRRFAPDLSVHDFARRGTAGIRTPVITPDGRFVPDVLELEDGNSFHIVNYNSPGATGAPAYCAGLVERLGASGFLDFEERSHVQSWRFDQG